MTAEYVPHDELPDSIAKYEDRQMYAELFNGLRNSDDPATWRTMVKNIRQLLGSPNPSHELPTETREVAASYVASLVNGTYLEPLTPEIMDAVGYSPQEGETFEDLDMLLINARHHPEDLLKGIADHSTTMGKSVAAFNAVGHYADGETRVVGPARLFRNVENAVFVASTQEIYGGSVAVLVNTLNLLRNPEFASRIKKVSILIPMFGGSRGHKLGQDPGLGYEVLQTRSNSKMILLMLRDILEDLGDSAPQVSIISVDIHNEKLPPEVFEEGGVEFKSICPMEEFAVALDEEITEHKLNHLPVRIVAVDKGAVSRTRRFAEAFLGISQGNNSVDLVQVEKLRNEAGEVRDAWIEKVITLTIDRETGQITESESSIENLAKVMGVRATIDDIIDTAGSLRKDNRLLDEAFESAYKVAIATHPIMSSGVNYALNDLGVDRVIVGNTVSPENISRQAVIRVVDLSSAIINGIPNLQ